MTTKCRPLASMALATILGGGAPLLALSPDCEGGIKGEVMPVEANGIKVEVNVHNSSPAEAPPTGRDDSAGKPGPTEYPGKKANRCTSDGEVCW